MKTDKLARFLALADKGRAFQDFTNDLATQAWFDALETRLTNDIAAGAMTLSSDQMRALAVALQTTKSLRNFIKSSVATGQRAEQDYAKLAGANTDA